jgi:predicted acylesterase/phospholipase RssA
MERWGVSRSMFLTAGAALGLTFGRKPHPAAAVTADCACSVKATTFLVLSGGTAHGAYEAGVLDGLRNTRFDYICGTSIGALNGAVFATDQPDRLRDLWQTIGSRTVLEPKPMYRDVFVDSAGVGTRIIEVANFVHGATKGAVSGFMRSEPVRAILTEILVEDATLRDFHTPLFWTVSDLTKGCAGFFARESSVSQASPASPSTTMLSNRLIRAGFEVTRASSKPSDFIEQLRASSAIPAVFDSASTAPFPDHTLVDGGITNNTPFELVRAAAPNGPVEVYTVLLGSPVASHRPDETKNILGIVQACFGLMQQRLIDDSVRALASDAQQFQRLEGLRQQLIDDQTESRRLLSETTSPGRNAAAVERMSAVQADALKRMDALIATAPIRQKVTIKVRAPSSALSGSSFDFHDQDDINTNYRLGKNDITSLGWDDFNPPPDLCSLNGR